MWKITLQSQRPIVRRDKRGKKRWLTGLIGWLNMVFILWGGVGMLLCVTELRIDVGTPTGAEL